MRHRASVAYRMVATCVAVALLATGCGDGSAGNAAAGNAQFDQQLHDRLPAAVRDRGTIRLATDPSYAPMESYARDGRTIVGFEPDLAAALASVLGVTAEMVAADFGTALDATQNGAYDGVLSAMTDTAEREKKADFVNYFAAGTSIVVQRGNPRGITDLKDLCGRVVAVETATVQVDLLHRAQSRCSARPIVVRTYKTNADALLQLRTGRAVAVLNDTPPAAHLAADQQTRANYQLASNVQYEPGLYGIAVAKENAALRDTLRDALERLIRSGTYAELLQRWGLPTGAVSAPTINAGS
jgi:polar amino acid transport system substrate-binding protein